MFSYDEAALQPDDVPGLLSQVVAEEVVEPFVGLFVCVSVCERECARIGVVWCSKRNNNERACKTKLRKKCMSIRT